MYVAGSGLAIGATCSRLMKSIATVPLLPASFCSLIVAARRDGGVQHDVGLVVDVPRPPAPGELLGLASAP